ncbi:MAG TPA: S41 family peptidase [Pyrinomonadaceae bacterium]|nr:S41 family peptidase [Pyrinomonadaceae bacterium]
MKTKQSLHVSMRTATLAAALCLFVIVLIRPALAQTPSADDLKLERNRGLVMLQSMKEYLKEYYYDPKYHGMDLEARFKAAEDKMKEAANLGQVLGIIAQAMSDLNDSHTFFVPPPHPVDVDYGWKMQMIGDTCYVVAVKPGSDAEAQGLKPGDEVLSLGGFKPTRQNIWKMEYNYDVLRPQPGKRVVVRTPDGQQRELALKAKVEKRPKQINLTELYNKINEDEEDEKKLPRYFELSSDIFIWKLREFGLTESKVGDTMKKVREHKALILDLRGNSGGYETTLKRMLGYFFDHDVTIGEVKRRKETKHLSAKTHGDKAFKGQLVVLIDSRSGSAAEIFARVIQLEKRGTIIGDRSAGAVMRAVFRPGLLGDVSNGNMILFGASVTDSDIILTDGNSLEGVGVTPDELILPAASDLAAKRDPVLARAAAILGVQLSPEKAGTLFPLELEK